MHRGLLPIVVAGTCSLTLLAAPLAGAPAARAAAAPHQGVSPADLAGDQPGQILSDQPVRIEAVGFTVPYQAWQLSYVSEDTTGQLQADVATVVKPEQASTEQASVQPQLVSYQPAIDSDAPNCQPSYVLTQPPTTQGYESLAGLESFDAVSTGVNMGYTMIIPDFEGPSDEWAAGIEAGYATLDGIRAAESFAPLGLPGAQTPVGLMGYSGGSQASEFAAEEAPSYAPELDLVGAAIGGLPVNIGDIATKLDGGPFAGLYFAAAVGVARAYPQIDIDSLLTAAGEQMKQDIGGMCLGQFAATYAFQRIESYTQGGLNPLADPVVQQVIADDTMGTVGVPQIPLQVYMASDDEVVSTPDVTSLVNQYCAAGATIQYVQFPLADHVSAEWEGLPGAIAWLQARFAGQPAPSTC